MSQPSPHTHRPPAGCPVCAQRLQITQLGCPSCGTGLTGAFHACEFCSLDAAQRDLLRVFLASRGNVRELERHLGVSYPTARARFDDLLRALGLTTAPADAPPAGGTGQEHADQELNRGELDRLATLRALARGDLDTSQARERLGLASDHPPGPDVTIG
jgi:hypothetical protein